MYTCYNNKSDLSSSYKNCFNTTVKMNHFVTWKSTTDGLLITLWNLHQHKTQGHNFNVNFHFRIHCKTLRLTTYTHLRQLPICSYLLYLYYYACICFLWIQWMLWFNKNQFYTDIMNFKSMPLFFIMIINCIQSILDFQMT